MAFYQDQEEQEEINGGQPVKTGAQSAVVGAGSTSQSAPSNTPAAPTSGGGTSAGRFTGIQDYLKQNKTQSQKMGNQVANTFNNQINKTQTSINDITPAFQNIADQGVIKNIDQADKDSQNIATQAATAQKGTEIDTNRFGEIANAKYTGPKTLLDTQLGTQAQQNIKDTNKYIGETSAKGNDALLADTFKPKTSYSSGINALDNLFLLGNQANRDKLNSARTSAQALQGSFDNTSKGASDYANSLTNKSSLVAQNAKNALEATRASRTGEIDTDLANQENNWMNEFNLYADKMRQANVNPATGTWSELDTFFDPTQPWIKNANRGTVNEANPAQYGNKYAPTNFDLTPEQAARLGVQEGQSLYDTFKGIGPHTSNEELSHLMTIDPYDAQRVISQDQQEQLARLDALASLYGGDATSKYNQADLAGTLNNKDALHSKLPQEIERNTIAFLEKLNSIKNAPPKQYKGWDEALRSWANHYTDVGNDRANNTKIK